jgi:hypothetical protein
VRPKRLFFRLPLDRINWLTSSFLIGTLALTLTAVPLYLWFFGLDWFQVVLFFVMLAGGRLRRLYSLPPGIATCYPRSVNRNIFYIIGVIVVIVIVLKVLHVFSLQG